MSNPMSKACPCGSSHLYRQCCHPFHSGASLPPTAESLMRSRYSAFVLQQAAYLVKTHHSDDTRATSIKIQELEQSFKDQQWVGLMILKHSKGSEADETGQVEFSAFYQHPQEPSLQSSSLQPSSLQQLHERSEFIKVEQQWLYVKGELLPPVKVGRNDPCICGSGKKFKKCHGQ